MKTGDTVQLSAHKSDGTCYRRWSVVVEAVAPDLLSFVAPVGSRVWDVSGEWVQQHTIRAYCWPEEPYILNEVYEPDGGLAMIYVNINSPIEIFDSCLRYTDCELDVILRPPHRAQIMDEDEFAEAAERYRYSESFQRYCYEVARRGVELAEGWVPRGAPNDTT